MDGAQERKLVPRWAPELIILSYCISWLGAYTSTQIIIHAKYTSKAHIRWIWILLASIAFGFCAIWSMHFVGMLACRLDVDIRFDISLTILSACVAVLFTFAALGSADLSETLQQSRLMKALHNRIHAALPWLSKHGLYPGHHDIEAGYLPLNDHDENATASVPEEHHFVHGTEEEAGYDGEDDDDREDALERGSPTSQPYNIHNDHRHLAKPSAASGLRGRPQATRGQSRRRNTSTTTSQPTSPPPPHSQASLRPAASTSAPAQARTSLDSDGTLSTDSSDETMSTTTLTSASWGESLHVGLSRETRLRIKAQSRDRPVPQFGWKYWVNAYYQSVTPLVLARATIWALAIAFMHYCGMWAMEIPDGRISWDMRIVVLSYVVAFLVCFLACTAMVHMEVNFGRQVAFSTIAAFGCCAMHYTGMAAATIYTYAPPDPVATYPMYLPITIIGIAFFVCIISNTTLAHNAISSRNRMAEVILTKRRLWRIMAEKEAAEQANELKQQFIAVASHEIRTPLHTVNGYCELLTRTELTEEQELYVTSIQQACHAINVIAGNVLDFSKLDRNNVELSARPVFMNLRKMIEDLARVTEARGIQPGQPGVDVVVSVAPDVPETVFLDEAYTFRVLMNLLSNAQKFTESGYICVSVVLTPADQLVIKVSDTGCGIPKSFRGALFEPFRQADTSLTRPRQGTGLGLSIVKHLVQRMSGTVDVTSTEGEGSTFTIQLPISPAPPSVQHSPAPLFSIPMASVTQRKRIRVVHRHKKTETLFVDLWNEHGHTAACGDARATAQELTKDTDLVWVDLESVMQSQTLRSLMRPDADNALPVFIVYSEQLDLATLEPELSTARNVVLMKRPIIMHNIVEVVQDPRAHMGKHILAVSPKVRFAIPPDRGEKFDEDEEATLALSKEKAREMDAPPMSLLFATAAGVMPPPVSIPQPVEREKVLLVEDNLVNQRLGCRLLEKLGYEVFTANDGAKALEAVKDTTFCCCLMDCQMPVLDGFAATRKIREMEANGLLYGRLPIIALTANVTQESEVECQSAGMDHFLPKPLKIADLDAALTRHRRHTPRL